MTTDKKVIDLDGEALQQKHKELRKRYENKICSKCIGTEQQKKRNCLKLHAPHSILHCDQMGRSVLRGSEKEAGIWLGGLAKRFYDNLGIENPLKDIDKKVIDLDKTNINKGVKD